MGLVEIGCDFMKIGINFYGMDKYGVCWEWLGSGMGNVEGNILSSLFIVLGNVYGYMGII